ncbi:P-loop NTPase fold protein [uncultured Pseudoalteromonas sp.]|mgnify:CR=1 FL=1|uniref:P-loop NTPase fold protein n=1 Tax=uncultured Pseudoalteromonas sp. TaxID=114053 RepID=UPI002597B778|nr:P-loop NTPase fold protein [uncultured Pseudoalteromonas sp.]
MSQVKTLPITATRWLSLLLCAITAATITVFLSKAGFVQKAYSSWSAILNGNPVLHYSSAFLAGIGVKLLLDNFYISHPKRSIEFNWRYPPVTIAVLASYFLTAFYMLRTAPKFNEAALYAQSFMSLKYLALTFIGMLITVIYQTKFYTQKPIFTAVLVGLSATFIIFAVSLADIAPAFDVFIYLAVSYLILAIYLLCDEYRQSKQQGSVPEGELNETKDSRGLNTLDDFQRWFADDRPIDHKSDLEPDLQVYADRIYNRLLKGGDEYQDQPLAQHIALCGSFGCGKSSIINAITNDLKAVSKKSGVWIHSDISTWGAASGSVAHVVLSNIIDDISQHIDMCAFRALPKHYTEALKSGGSVFQFASSLLVGPVDIEGSFQKLNGVLGATNHKLLITLQDVDRGTGDENEKRLNDIAALLDRLRNRDLSHINFIVAVGNDKPLYIEVISKATDYREDIAKIDFRKTLASFIKSSIDEAENNHNKIILYRYSSTHETNKLDLINAIIDSPRQFKKILRRVNQAWQSDKLMGEVNFYSLLMVIALRESNPVYFERYCKADSYLESKIKSNEDYLDNILREIAQLSKKDSVSQEGRIIKSEFIYVYLQVMLDVKKDSNGKLKLDPRKDHEQSVGCTHSDIYYLRRILLEKVPSNELKDQDVMKALRNGENKEKLNNYIHEAQYSLFESNALLCPKSMR